jgi:coniferyl-aldehyde dehydrogenase
MATSIVRPAAHDESPPAPDPAAPLRELLALQRAAFARGAPDHRARVAALDALHDAVRANQEAIVEAVSDDFGGRAREETLLLEIFPLLAELRHARSRLKRWMRPRRVRPVWYLMPAAGRVEYQPLGVVGVIGAWNYGLFLSLSPLVGALAAGNHVMVKPSEVTPRTADVIARLLAERFPREHVAAVTGGADVAAAFSGLPFDHLLFTGSTRVGQLVAQAASAHLTPVTLELGGKSPAIVHRAFDAATAAERVVAGKLLNAGQTCVAPDYALVPAGAVDAFVAAARAAATSRYPRLVDNADYTRLVTRRHWERLDALVAEARAAGARVEVVNPAGEACTAENRVFPLTLVSDPPGRRVLDDLALMREELFGPVLPVLAYDAPDDAAPAAAIAYVNARPRPLALYVFDTDARRADAVLARTTSGGAMINDVVYHVGHAELPFGGVGPSGSGRYHGFAGFETFSNRKGILARGPFSGLDLLRPPYGGRSGTLIRWLLGRA